MKENDGKAAKRRVLRRLVLAGGACLCIGALLWAEGLFSSPASFDRRRSLRRTTSSGRTNKRPNHRRMSGNHGPNKSHNDKNDNNRHGKKDGRRRPPPPPRDRQQQQRGGGRGGGGGGAFGEFDEAEMIDKILEAEVNLVALGVDGDELERSHPSSYAGVYAHFCELNFAAHKKDPAAVPMFRDLVSKSEDCSDRPGENFKIGLKKIVDLARQRDSTATEQGEAVPKVLNLTAVAFHESRCGSTLVANAFLGMNPAKHRVYTESQPGSQALKQICGEAYERCTVDQAAAILKDAVYMMSRSNDPKEERVFFKFQSITSKNIAVFKKAFPEVPWLFVYRDPVQVMMSHVRDDPTLKRAKCVSSQMHGTPKDVKAIAKRHGRIAKEMPPEEYCAAHLASISEGAVRELDDNAIPVNYDGLVDDLHREVLPRILGRPLTESETSNLLAVTKTYSKGRGDRHRDFRGDSDQKEASATDTVRDAAELILRPSYVELSNFAPKIRERELPG